MFRKKKSLIHNIQYIILLKIAVEMIRFLVCYHETLILLVSKAGSESLNPTAARDSFYPEGKTDGNSGL